MFLILWNVGEGLFIELMLIVVVVLVGVWGWVYDDRLCLLSFVGNFWECMGGGIWFNLLYIFIFIGNFNCEEYILFKK